MSFRFLELVFGIAYVVLCALLAAVCIRAKARALFDRVPDDAAQPAPQQSAHGSRMPLSLAACAALAAVLGIPLGSLPVLIPFAWGALAVPACLALASGFAGAWHWDGATRRQARVLALLGLSLALCAWYARQRGVPGELCSLDSYVATPLAGLMGWRERCGLLLLASALLLAVRDVQRDLASGLVWVTRLDPGEARVAVALALVRQIWVLAVLGMAVCLFAPFSPAGRFGMSGITGTAADALFFLLKVLLADHALWLAGTLCPRHSPCLPWAQVLLAALGALCLFL